MAEERTVSTFTWMTPALHANLSVGQMAAKTIVHQHYATEKKAHKHSKPRPTVKFYDVKSKIFWTTDTSDSPKVLDDEDNSWLDEKAESHPTAQSLGAETNRSSPVNLQSSMLATFLVDEKPKSEGHNKSKSKPVLAPGDAPSANLDDNNFLMLFD
ncbi:hypothetical protein CPB84DRAFT_1842574 [Gymnopilus junonius]|uniref:Uncharacterized protein n=1 Tax=Gymnopilus junonius TaxID=109634 RepID=A0A9P5NY17_GYMJU|nr:hypothetical protein CPB84DRAFT_1842574 [Gymnopilus junonius]